MKIVSAVFKIVNRVNVIKVDRRGLFRAIFDGKKLDLAKICKIFSKNLDQTIQQQPSVIRAKPITVSLSVLIFFCIL